MGLGMLSNFVRGDWSGCTLVWSTSVPALLCVLLFCDVSCCILFAERVVRMFVWSAMLLLCLNVLGLYIRQYCM